MVEPIVLPRDQHTLSRRDIDPDALKVLYRLHQAHHVAYLVGGSVRDLLLGRRPKDFDVGTSAHPYQVKKLFRNCWIIGRRFRLAHVRFGAKTIEVATFRRQVPAGTEEEPPVHHASHGSVSAPASALALDHDAHDGDVLPRDDRAEAAAVSGDRLVFRDNTFGTPEEDAFRRDFTVNALFYDVATFSIIDYTGGLEDLQARVIRAIGVPEERFLEDPVRMLRAVVLAARLGFTVDPPALAAIRRIGREIVHSAPARLMEEYYKVLRSGAATAAFSALAETGLLRHISPEIPTPLPPELVRSLDALDRYRSRFTSTPETFTNPLLLGSLIVPLGLLQRRPRRRSPEEPFERQPVPSLGALPVPRRDVERLAQLLALQRRLADLDAPPRAQRSLAARPMFADALAWLEIHGARPDVVAHWRRVMAEDAAPEDPRGPAQDGPAVPDLRRPARRRRRRGRRAPVTLD